MRGERAGVGNPFIDSTQVRAVGDGRYAATIDPMWNLRPIPQGGIVTAITLRAMQDALADPAQRLRTLHTTFVAQVTDGPVTVDVDILRRGRSMSHVRGDIANDGAARGHTTSAVFGAARRGFEFTDLRAPDHPHPDDCPSWRDPPPPGVPPFEPMPFWLQVEGRAVLGHAPWEEYVPDRAETVSWHRFDDPPFLDDGTIDPLGLVVLADTMPGAVGEKLGRNSEWFAPSVDLYVHILDQCCSPWVLMHNTARHAGGGYASADMALWDCGPDCDQEPRLVVYATQLFLFTFQ